MAFVFQGNANNYDIDTYLTRERFIYWRAPRLSHEIRIGDQIVIWRSGRLQGAVALGHITELPNAIMNLEHPEALGVDLWRDSQNVDSTKRAGISIDEVRLSIGEGMVTREVCKNDPILKQNAIITNPQGTVFRLSDDEFARFYELWNSSNLTRTSSGNQSASNVDMIGEIEGVIEGQIYENRRELHDANVHRGLMRGIGARGESIVLSGGYADDKDYGDEIIYTGEGGRDSSTGLQVSDQTLTGGNLALYNHYREGNPIRVSRGSNADSSYAPPSGYKYGGLYRIENVWSDIGRDGYKIWRYKFIKLSNSEIITPTITSAPPQGLRVTQRTQVTTSRIIRSSAIGNYVKRLYDYTCQISGVQLDTPNGRYAEACHIQPVGRPHNGPDDVSNVLCLSPNMHVLFDLGAISINDDLTLIGIEGILNIRDEHDLSQEAIRYHRENIFIN
jgi:putative restriction endonuclease